MTYNLEGKQIRLGNLAGQVTTTAWDCCHKVSETQPDGSTTTWDYDGSGRMIAASRLIPLDMTNVTWLTTCYEYDGLGRQTATWKTNYAEHVGLPAVRTRRDALGRVVARMDAFGNETTTSYSADGLVASTANPNTSTAVYTRNAGQEVLSVTGSAVVPEFRTSGVLPDGTRWNKAVQGETADSPRFTKRYLNMLGQVAREEKSGFLGATLATVNEYDGYGRLVRTAADGEPAVEYSYDEQGSRVATTRVVDDVSPGQWRRSETRICHVLLDGAVWLAQTNIVSCSDTSIAPLVTSTARQLSGLSQEIPSRTRMTDVRGNVTEDWTHISGSTVTAMRRIPSASNVSETASRFGAVVMVVSVSCVTNTYDYDALGRRVAHTDGRGTLRLTGYDALGRKEYDCDTVGLRTAYAYDQFGNIVAVSKPLRGSVVYEYDIKDRKTYEGGATYPVRYTYDVFGNKTSMMTYRDESLGPDSGDVTMWLYDEASGCMTNKVYADGKGPTYWFTASGTLSRRVWARGVATEYSYDGWGNLTNTAYSDATPAVLQSFDSMGRQTEVRDAAGVTTFAYDVFGSITNETVVGVSGTNTIERHWDSFGRSLGYSLNGVRQSTLAYDLATGRLVSMLAAGSATPFEWSYLDGSNLKSSLSYPNGMTASWLYDENGRLLQVCNAFQANTVSQYDYVYEAAGLRVFRSHSGSAFARADTIAYRYNMRGELTNAVDEADSDYGYSYDDIGNRISSKENGVIASYESNALNQYTSISEGGSDFCPLFDDDGNQTLVKTATGVWAVSYNGENRPVLWSSGTTNIVMSFDRMGRRVVYAEAECGVTNECSTFSYDGYVCIARRSRVPVAADAVTDCFTWDPTEPMATRPLVFARQSASPCYYSFDGNKNVSELVCISGSIQSHYEYTPFGLCRHIVEARLNPYMFSAEYMDETLNLVCYNYRHYNPWHGRWWQRDSLSEYGGINLYLFVQNDVCNSIEYRGRCPIVLLYPGTWVVVATFVEETIKAAIVTAVSLILVEVSENVYQTYVDECGECKEGPIEVRQEKRTRRSDDPILNACIEACWKRYLPSKYGDAAEYNKCLRRCRGL